MSELPGDLKYTKEHEWLRQEEDGTVTIGITDHAQSALGDLVYVELPEVGQEVESGGEMAVVESVKAASDVYAPISGEVVASTRILPMIRRKSTRTHTAMAGSFVCNHGRRRRDDEPGRIPGIPGRTRRIDTT